jgi:hypothetical protein
MSNHQRKAREQLLKKREDEKNKDLHEEITAKKQA